MILAAEATALGLASGPACLASCGPALLPWMVAERPGRRRGTLLLSIFLGGRLAGYLAFAVLAGLLGAAIPAGAREITYAVAHLGLAAVLVVYGLRPPDCRPAPELISIAPRRRAWTPLLLGLFTGLNLCPPFFVAAARATETGSVAGAAGFFLAFFLGTAVWFLPFAAVGVLRIAETVAVVARYTLLALSAYYGYLGIVGLLRRLVHA